MGPRRESPTSPASPAWYGGLFVGVAGLAGAITLMFHAMRSVMEVGGACGSGGQYQLAVPCPDGVGPAMLLAIFGGLLALGLTMLATWRTKAPSVVLLAWPGLFMSLGVNFLQDGFSPSDDSGPHVGSIICGIVFELMGGVPLVLLLWMWFGKVRRPAGSAHTTPVPTAAPPTPMSPEIESPLSAAWLPASGPLPAGSPVPVGDSNVDLDGDDDPRLVERLQQLADLHRRGDLTDAEFRAAKQSLLPGEAGR